MKVDANSNEKTHSHYYKQKTQILKANNIQL